MPSTANRKYISTLRADYTRCIENCFKGSEEEQQFWRRMAFATWFNFVEGWIRIHREDVIPKMAEKRGEAIFREFGWDPNEELPERKPEKRFLDVLKRLVMELFILSRRHPDDYKRLLTTDRWKSFRLARTIRNHLAHPTCDWMPTIERMEMEALMGAFDWFLEFVNAVDYSDCDLPDLGNVLAEAVN